MRPKLKAVPTVFKGLKDSLIVLYEHFFLSISASLLWSICHMPLLYIISFFSEKILAKKYLGEVGLYLFLVLPLVAFISSAANAGVFHLIKLLHDEEVKTTIFDFFTGIKKYYVKSWQITASYYLILGILIFNMFIINYFFHGLVQVFFASVTFFLIVFLGLTFNYAFPFLVQQAPAYKKMWQKVILMTIDNGGVSFVLGMTVALLTLFTRLFPLTFLFVYIVMVGGLQYSVFRQLFARYD